MQEAGGLAGARRPREMRGAWNLCEGESSNKTQGHLLIAQESRKKGTCEDGIFEVENRNAFIEVCISFVIVLHGSFIYLFGKCLLHPSVGRAQRGCQEFTEQRQSCCPVAVTRYLLVLQ